MENNAIKRLVVTGILALALAGNLFAQSAPRYALVIGNAAYRNIGKLTNTVNDAEDIAAALRGLGYQVDLQKNIDIDGFDRAMERYTANLRGNSQSEGFFWYAGHGVQIEGENYLLPVDIPETDNLTRIERGSYTLTRLLADLEKTRNKLNVVVLDACRNNPLPVTVRGAGERGLSIVANVPGDLIIMYSTAAGTKALDGEGKRNSPFAQAFLKHIATPDPFTTVMTDITRETLALTGNVQRPFQAGSIIRERLYTLNPKAAPAQQWAPQPAPAPQQPAARVERPAVPDNFVRIEGGTFTMGSPSTEVNHESDEVQHQVTVGSFYMGKKELTVGEFRQFVNAAAYKTTAETSGGGYVWANNEWQQKADANWKNPYFSQNDNHPVVLVSWNDAVAYCNWRSKQEGLTPAYTVNGDNVTWNKNATGYRLPTEAEWEYACRAGTATPFSTGSNITTAQANYNGNYPYNNNSKGTYREKTTDVGTFAANRWGLYDMHGNVWEWCWDWYGSYPSGAQSNPDGAVSGAGRVIRGGSWDGDGRSLRSANRYGSTPSNRDGYLGFRLVRP